MRRVLVLICLLLIYGSLYPWHFTGGPPWLLALGHVPRAWPARLHASDVKDILLNLAIYLPVGFCGYLGWARRSQAFRLLAPGLLGMALSWLIEAAQHYVPSRNPSALDLVCNTLGACAGTALAWAYERVVQQRLRSYARRRNVRLSSALLLLMIWLGAMSFPGQLVGNSLVGKARFLLRGGLQWPLIAGECVAVLVAGALLYELVEPGRLWTGACGLWLLTLLTRFASPGHWLTGGELLGGALGLALLAWRPLGPARLRPALALAWLLWLVVDGLQPWRWIEPPAPFGWVPFLDMLGGPWLATLVMLLNKLWRYGAGFWLLERGGLRRWLAAAALAGVVLAIEVAQLRLPGRFGGLTDPALAGLACLLIWAVEQRYERRFA